MNLKDNKYFYDVMSKYFLILIEMNLYSYRLNNVRINRHNDDKASGIFNAIKEISLDGFVVVCVNFDSQYPVEHNENLHFITDKSFKDFDIVCDFLFLFGDTESDSIRKLCNTYVPKFVFLC